MDRARHGVQDGILCIVFCDRLYFLFRHMRLFTIFESMLDVDLSCMRCILFNCEILFNYHLVVLKILHGLEFMDEKYI